MSRVFRIRKCYHDLPEKLFGVCMMAELLFFFGSEHEIFELSIELVVDFINQTNLISLRALHE